MKKPLPIIDSLSTNNVVQSLAGEPLVTIGIPTYNRGDGRLQLVVSTALSQSWKNIEVLVSDNASTDNTAQIMRSMSDPRIRYVRQDKNIGSNANFNFLLDEARGQWFLLFHDDDLIDTDFVECCIKTLGARDDVGFIVTGVRSINADGDIIKEMPNQLSSYGREDFYLGWFGYKFALYFCNTLYNTEKLRKVGGFRSLHYLLEDNFALAKLLEHWRYIALDEVKASFRYTYNQRTFNEPVSEWCRGFQQLLERILEHSPDASMSSLQSTGHRFFGQLCIQRANAANSPARKLWGRLVVAKYFGIRTLRRSWKLRA